MKIEAGKRYVRRDGVVTGVLRWSEQPDARLVDPKHFNPPYEVDGTFKGRLNTSDQFDLISEYIEPTAEEKAREDAIAYGTGFVKVMPDGVQEYIKPKNFYANIKESVTAEPQDEWGPWSDWLTIDAGIPAKSYYEKSNETEYSHFMADNGKGGKDAVAYRYRIKKEPDVVEQPVWLDKTNCAVFESEAIHENIRKAIITLTGGKLDIDWADVDDDNEMM